MDRDDFAYLEALYERASKPRWPWWWYVWVFLIVLVALILILCSGPRRTQAEEPVPVAATVETCAAAKETLLALARAAVHSAFLRVQVGLQLAGVSETERARIATFINSGPAMSIGEAAIRPEFYRHAKAILLALGCKDD